MAAPAGISTPTGSTGAVGAIGAPGVILTGMTGRYLHDSRRDGARPHVLAIPLVRERAHRNRGQAALDAAGGPGKITERRGCLK